MALHEVKTPVGGSVWAHSVGIGQHVVAGTTLLICECMKMEIPIQALIDGSVQWLASCGQNVEADDVVAIVDDAK